MGDKEGPMLGVTVKGCEAPEGDNVAPRAENPTPNARPSATASETKKKRGRPRKYAPDGSLAVTLSPMPISSSIPLAGEFPLWKQGRGRRVDSVKKSHKFELDSSPGDKIGHFVGANFTPHIITVNAGEDVTMKVMSFSQQGDHAICILSANGSVSNVTLRQPTSSGGTLTYEGRFEILSMSGSFMPTISGVTNSRSGGMSISLAGPDGRVLGGGLAGLLIAAGPVQVVVGSFIPGHQQKQRIKPAAAVVSANTLPTMPAEVKVSHGGVMPILTSPFNLSSLGNLNPIQGHTNSAIDNKSSSTGDESEGHSLSQ